MLRKPLRFNTDLLYKESKVLRVRQLFILRATIATHASIIKSSDYGRMLDQRIFKVPVPSVHTTFAKKHPLFLLPRVYNTVCRKINIKSMSVKEVKSAVENWLRKFNYFQTEVLVIPY